MLLGKQSGYQSHSWNLQKDPHFISNSKSLQRPKARIRDVLSRLFSVPVQLSQQPSEARVHKKLLLQPPPTAHLQTGSLEWIFPPTLALYIYQTTKPKPFPSFPSSLMLLWVPQDRVQRRDLPGREEGGRIGKEGRDNRLPTQKRAREENSGKTENLRAGERENKCLNVIYTHTNTHVYIYIVNRLTVY